MTGSLVRCANRRLRAALMNIADNLTKCNQSRCPLHSWVITTRQGSDSELRAVSNTPLFVKNNDLQRIVETLYRLHSLASYVTVSRVRRNRPNDTDFRASVGLSSTACESAPMLRVVALVVTAFMRSIGRDGRSRCRACIRRMNPATTSVQGGIMAQARTASSSVSDGVLRDRCAGVSASASLPRAQIFDGAP